MMTDLLCHERRKAGIVWGTHLAFLREHLVRPTENKLPLLLVWRSDQTLPARLLSRVRGTGKRRGANRLCCLRLLRRRKRASLLSRRAALLDEMLCEEGHQPGRCHSDSVLRYDLGEGLLTDRGRGAR